MILDDGSLDRFFESGHRAAEALQLLANLVGAKPVADYHWEVVTAERIVRHLRRVTPLGMVGVQEDGSPTAGDAWSLRIQMVSWRGTPEVAIVRKESAGDQEKAYWEMHVGDGNPRPIKEADLAAGFAFVQAALQAIART